MFLVCYLAQDDRHISAVQERLALAAPPMALVIARTAPDVLSQVQNLPVQALMADADWPRSLWEELRADLRHLRPQLPILALAPAALEQSWWQVADDVLRLDEHPELFLHRLLRSGAPASEDTDLEQAPPPSPTSPVTEPPWGTSILENSQFRQFADVLTGVDENGLLEAFVSWAQQACQTSRAAILMRDSQTGEFVCRAQRGLPSTLVPHCRLAQTAPLCRWLASTGRILAPGDREPHARRAAVNLDLLQAVVAVPILHDGQLVGILGLGPRLLGPGYSAAELEAIFTLAGHVAMAVHNARAQRGLRQQKEMTEHILGVMPTGTLVLGEDQRIAFVNAPAAALLDKTREALHGMDLRALPSPLGDLAYEALTCRSPLPRRELTIATSGRLVAVTGFPLDTMPPSALLLLEDLSARKALEEERERRVDLEVVTNLAHYLAHELRNPLVALSTFADIAPTRADDPEFQEFCESVLHGEIARVNLILEQLLVLTHHAEFQFDTVDLTAILERVTESADMKATVVPAIPVALPPLPGDRSQLETALTCILRTAVRLSNREAPATMRVEVMSDAVVIRVESPASAGLAPERLLDPWQQLLDGSDEQVDFGLATAQYILRAHGGALDVSIADKMLTIICRLPLRNEEDDHEEKRHGATKGARR